MPRHGEAIYHRKDGLWEARYVKEVDAQGKKKYGSVYGHTYREAKEKRQDALDRIVLCQGTTPIRSLTVAELTREWLLVNQTRLKTSSYQRYEGFYRNHIEKNIGSVRIVYMTTTTLHAFAVNRLESGLSPQSVNAVLVFLHSVLVYGGRQYKLSVPDIVYLAVPKKEMRVLSVEEQQALVKYLMTNLDIYKLGVLMALYMGLRIGELCGLQWGDIRDDCITVRRTVQRLKKEHGTGTVLHVGTPKTNSSTRVVPIPSFLQPLIEGFRGEEDEQYFLTARAQELPEPRTMQYKFTAYLKAAEVEPANFHALRHTFATRCVECGFEIKSLSEVLGHSNVNTTLNKYVHSSLELKRENMERLKLTL